MEAIIDIMTSMQTIKQRNKEQIKNKQKSICAVQDFSNDKIVFCRAYKTLKNIEMFVKGFIQHEY